MDWETIIYLLLTISTLVHLCYWIFLFARLSITDAPSGSSTHSILSCYKNEEDKLPTFLDNIVEQKAMEIILVDDYSTDDSYEITKQITDDRLNRIKAIQDRPGKKMALYTGVSLSANEKIVMTDVDCKPASTLWSSIMAGTDGDIVLGYAPTSKSTGAVARYAQYETYLTGIQYLSYAQQNMAYMGVGRNMAVSKSKVLPILESMTQDNLASGDDDLMVQGIAPHGTVATCLDSKTFVYSDPPSSLGAFLSQKARHMTTSTKYAFKHQLLLGLFAGTHVSLFALSILLVVLNASWWGPVLLVLFTKWIIQMTINSKLMALLDEKDLFWRFPLLDIATFVYYVVMTPYLLLKSKSTWS